MDTHGLSVAMLFDVAQLGLPAFQERAPWVGGDLQTLRNVVRRPAVDLSAYRAERLVLPLRDGTGDSLVGSLHQPRAARAARGARPLVVLIHGLTGSEDSVHIRVTAACLLRAGFPVLRLNMRGAGASRRSCRFHYHAGRSEDLAHAFAALPADATEGGVAAVGFSLGGNVLLKYLGEVGRQSPLTAAVAVSSPLDLAATAHCIMAPRNAVYHWYFLRDCQREAAASLGAEECRPALDAQSLWEFDDRMTAPRNGFASAGDYYARSSALNFLDGIAVPTLLLHSEDDPIVPAEAYHAYSWSRNRRLLPAIERRGGHVGFHDRNGGVWHDRAIKLFLERTLSLS